MHAGVVSYTSTSTSSATGRHLFNCFCVTSKYISHRAWDAQTGEEIGVKLCVDDKFPTLALGTAKLELHP